MNYVKLFLINIFILNYAFAIDVYQLSPFEIDTQTEVSSFEYTLKNLQQNEEIKVGLIASPMTFLPNTNKESAYEASILHDSLFKKDLSNGMNYKLLIAKIARLDNLKNWVEFDINELANFSDGTKISAKDIEFSYKFFLNNGNDYTKSMLRNIDNVKILNDSSIRFDLKKQSVDTILFIASLPILSKKSWDNQSIQKFDNIVFSGPYIAEGKNFKSVKYSYNTAYGLKNIPSNAGYNNFETIIVNSYSNTQELKNAYENSSIDISLDTFPSTKEIGKIEIKESNEIISGIVLNTSKTNLNTSISRQGFLTFFSAIIPVKNASLFSNPLYQGRNINVIDSSLSGYYDNNFNPAVFTNSKAFDFVDSKTKFIIQITKAVSVLKSAGYLFKDNKLSKNNAPISFSVLVNKDNVEHLNTLGELQNQLKIYGINLKANVLSSAEYERRLQSFDYDMAFISKPFSAIEKKSFLDFFYNSGKQNYFKINSQVLNNIINDLQNAISLNEYSFKVKVIDKVVMFDYIFFPIQNEGNKVLFSNTQIQCPRNLMEFKISLCN